MATAHIFTYLFKYVLKGDDRNRAQVVVDGQQCNGRQGDANSSTHNRDEARNEIYEWRDMRETCAPQAYWRACEYISYGQEPPCEKLSVHAPRQRSEVDKGFSNLEKYHQRPELSSLKNVTFEEWEQYWEVGKTAPKACEARRPDDPDCLVHYARDANAKDRVRAVYELICTDDRGGRNASETYYCYPRLAESQRLVRLQRVPRTSGHAFYLRMLAKHVPARSFDEWLTVGDDKKATFEESCRARGFLNEDTEARAILREAVEEGDAPVQVRSLFAMLTSEGYPTAAILKDPELYDDTHSLFEYMKRDFVQQDRSSADAANLCLLDLDLRLNHMGKSMDLFFDAAWCPKETKTEVDRMRLKYSDAAEQRAICERFPLDSIPGCVEQSAIRNWCLSGNVRDAGFRREAGVEVAFAQGEAGTGKTQLANHTLAAVRAEGAIALVTAATNLAATLFEGGWSLHALAKIPIEKDRNGNLFIKMVRQGGAMTPQRLALLQECALLVVDEGPCLDKAVLEALLDFLREQGCTMRVLICGDLRQIPPVVAGGSRQQIVEASIVSSHEFSRMRKFRLTTQYRAAADDAWAADVRALGDGTATTLPKHRDADMAKGVSVVPMPLVTTLFHQANAEYRKAAVEWLFGRDADGRLDVGTGQKAIICMKNTAVNEWNEYVSALLAAESNATSREYVGWHELDCTEGLDAGDGTKQTTAIGRVRLFSHVHVVYRVCSPCVRSRDGERHGPRRDGPDRPRRRLGAARQGDGACRRRDAPAQDAR